MDQHIYISLVWEFKNQFTPVIYISYVNSPEKKENWNLWNWFEKSKPKKCLSHNIIRLRISLIWCQPLHVDSFSLIFYLKVERPSPSSGDLTDQEGVAKITVKTPENSPKMVVSTSSRKRQKKLKPYLDSDSDSDKENSVTADE